jgi:hypothetical protein
MVGGGGTCPTNLSEQLGASTRVIDRVQLIYDDRKWAIID